MARKWTVNDPEKDKKVNTSAPMLNRVCLEVPIACRFNRTPNDIVARFYSPAMIIFRPRSFIDQLSAHEPAFHLDCDELASLGSQ